MKMYSGAIEEKRSVLKVEELLGYLPSLPSIGSWERLGVPVEMIPSEFPFPPVPRGVVYKVYGLAPWYAYALYPPNVLEYLGKVWAASEGEAIEAAEHQAEGTNFMAVKVEEG